MRTLEVVALTPTTGPRIATALGVPVRTVRHMLAQLERDGCLSHNRGQPRIYAPTLRLLALAAHVGARSPLATLIGPALEALSAETGLVCGLMIPAYDGTVCLVRSTGGDAVQPTFDDAPAAHCTAAGKVLMAYRPRWRDAILARPLPAYTHRTVADPTVLADELEEVRGRGYATEEDEYVLGRRCAAAPVVLPTGDVPAALTIGTRTHVMLETLVTVACRGALELSRTLADAAERFPLAPDEAHRLLGSYGLAPINAYM